MKKLLFFLLFFLSNSLASNSKIIASYAIGIFHENGKGENIQHTRETLDNYDGTCFSRIVIMGNYLNSRIEVKIGNSLGHFQNSTPVYNKQKIKIGDELTFKHYNVSKGYFEVKIDGKLYDAKVFVK